MTEREMLSEQLNVMVTPTMKALVEDQAHMQRIRPAEVVRKALGYYLRELPPAGVRRVEFGGEGAVSSE